jgi:hypothetical protein
MLQHALVVLVYVASQRIVCAVMTVFAYDTELHRPTLMRRYEHCGIPKYCSCADACVYDPQLFAYACIKLHCMQAVHSHTALTSAAYAASVLGHQATCTLTFKVLS